MAVWGITVGAQAGEETGGRRHATVYKTSLPPLPLPWNTQSARGVAGAGESGRFTSGETETHSLLRLFCFLGDPLRGGRLPLALHSQGLALCSLIFFCACKHLITLCLPP